MRLSYWRKTENDEAVCLSVREAKKRLKAEGGVAWTEHYDRDGGMFEVTKIELKGNNSNHKYNRHL